MEQLSRIEDIKAIAILDMGYQIYNRKIENRGISILDNRDIDIENYQISRIIRYRELSDIEYREYKISESRIPDHWRINHHPSNNLPITFYARRLSSTKGIAM